MKILTPAGTHAAPGAAGVSELILSRETPMRVLAVRPGSGNTPGEIILEVQS